MKFDVVLVGVGGQGLLTLGDILTEAAMARGIPANFLPTKGMAQRGGFVKAELRLGRVNVGPRIPEKSADLIIAMEVSEALKAVRFVKVDGEFLLFHQVWSPTEVLLGKADYPELDLVEGEIRDAGAHLISVDPYCLPRLEDELVPANIYVLGAALGRTQLKKVVEASDVQQILCNRWKHGIERNLLAFQAGLECE